MDVIPKISPDYYLRGEPRPRSSTPTPSREERRLKVEQNFLSSYKKEHPDQLLSKEDEGIVVLQQNSFGVDLFYNPTPEDNPSMRVIRMDKVQKGFSWVYYSGTYFLKKGKIKKLLDATTVLRDDVCDVVASKLLKDPVYEGVFKIFFGKGVQRFWRPYRLYSAKRSVLLINMLNGMVFKMNKEDLPETSLLGDRFGLETMRFRRSYRAYERY